MDREFGYDGLMKEFSSFRDLFGNNLALAVGGESLWLVRGVNGAISQIPAYAAVHKEGGRLAAVGEEALRLKRMPSGNTDVMRVTRSGGFEVDLGEAVLRDLFRKSTSRWALAPRVLVACPQLSKRSVKDAVIYAGARDIITLPSTMAAALGAGLAVEKSELQSVFILERDWCAYALINCSRNVAAFERAGGVDILLEDVAAHRLMTHGLLLDMDETHGLFSTKGLVGSELLEREYRLDERTRGQASLLPAGQIDFWRNSLAFQMRLNMYHRHALSGLSNAMSRDAVACPLHFFGPYAALPGMVDLVGRAFHQSVIVPEDSARAMIRGAQKILADLSSILRNGNWK